MAGFRDRIRVPYRVPSTLWSGLSCHEACISVYRDRLRIGVPNTQELTINSHCFKHRQWPKGQSETQCFFEGLDFGSRDGLTLHVRKRTIAMVARACSMTLTLLPLVSLYSQSRGWIQTDLAFYSRRKGKFISRVNNGKTNSSLETVEKLARVFWIPVEKLSKGL